MPDAAAHRAGHARPSGVWGTLGVPDGARWRERPRSRAAVAHAGAGVAARAAAGRGPDHARPLPPVVGRHRGGPDPGHRRVGRRHAPGCARPPSGRSPPAGPVLVATQQLVASLAEADAAASAAFLSGQNEDPEQRRLYEQALARAGQQVEEIAALAGDDDDHPRRCSGPHLVPGHPLRRAWSRRPGPPTGSRRSGRRQRLPGRRPSGWPTRWSRATSSRSPTRPRPASARDQDRRPSGFLIALLVAGGGARRPRRRPGHAGPGQPPDPQPARSSLATVLLGAGPGLAGVRRPAQRHGHRRRPAGRLRLDRRHRPARQRRLRGQGGRDAGRHHRRRRPSGPRPTPAPSAWPPRR